jgi:ubiquinone/menaquinone biosynthesis C-methylase UbiE
MMEWIAYLDAVAQGDFMRGVKQQITQMLELHPGDNVLDAGCGTGDDARAMAALVGPHGLVTGLDHDDEILEEARRRSKVSDLPLAFVRGDVQQLAYADATFSRCRSERMFQHVADQHAAMRELARVLCPGGLAVVYDTDWETLIIDADDWKTTRSLMQVHCAEHRHGWIGRMLPGLMGEAGLGEITVVPQTLMIRDLTLAEKSHTLHKTAELAVAQNHVMPEEVEAWFDDLQRRDAQGRFFCAVTSFIVKGRKL